MVTASVITGGVADPVAARTVDVGTIAVARSADQRTVFMVGHVLTLFAITRGDRLEPVGIDWLPSHAPRR
jgi:hypothetical protein